MESPSASQNPPFFLPFLNSIEALLGGAHQCAQILHSHLDRKSLAGL